MENKESFCSPCRCNWRHVSDLSLHHIFFLSLKSVNIMYNHSNCHQWDWFNKSSDVTSAGQELGVALMAWKYVYYSACTVSEQQNTCSWNRGCNYKVLPFALYWNSFWTWCKKLHVQFGQFWSPTSCFSLIPKWWGSFVHWDLNRVTADLN